MTYGVEQMMGKYKGKGMKTEADEFLILNLPSGECSGLEMERND